jgi:hypothetical protein
MVDEADRALMEDLKKFARDPEKYFPDSDESYEERSERERKKIETFYKEVLGIDTSSLAAENFRRALNVISLDEARERKRAQHSQFTQAYSDSWTQRAVGGARRGGLAEGDMGWFVAPMSFKCVQPDEGLYSIIVKGFGEDVLSSLRESDAETFLPKLIFFFDGIPIEPYNVKLDPKGQRFLIEFFLFEDDDETFELDCFESNIEDDGRIRIQLWTK